MASATPRQDRFDGGELAETWYGRTDSPRYGISLRTCKNFLPIQHGALVNRPGWAYVGAPRATDPKYARFVFSDAQTFVLEFTNGWVRFWTNGGLVVDGGGNAIEVATPYGQADLDRLKFAQSGDVVSIRHPAYQPRSLTRLSNVNWVLALDNQPPIAFFGTGNPPTLQNFYLIPGNGIVGPLFNPATVYAINDLVSFVDAAGNVGQWISLQNANTGHAPETNSDWWVRHSWASPIGPQPTYKKGDYAFYQGLLYFSLADGNLNQNPTTAGSTYWVRADDAARPATTANWVVTELWRDEHGVGHETLPSTPLVSPYGGKFPRYTDRPVTVSWGLPAAGAGPAFYKIIGHNVYLGANGIFGLLGTTDGTTSIFQDKGQAANFAIQPPRATNPFLVADGKGTANTSKWPGCVTHHESRRVEARTDVLPNHFFGSKQDDFGNHDVNFPVQATDAYDFGISSHELEEIRSIVSFHRLLLFTGQGVFSAEGAPGNSLTPNSVRVVKHSKAGSSYLDPLLLEDSAVLFNTAKGNYVRDLIYDFQTNTYRVGKIDIYARHLLKGHTIIDWCFAEVPFGVLWAVRDDGVLLSCTYDRDTQTIGWARHPTRGKVRRVVCVPEGTEDAVYVHVVRNNVLCFERMASRILPQVADGIDEDTGLTKYRDDVRFGVFLDSSKTFDGRNTGVTTMKATGASYDAEQLVTVEVSDASFLDSDIGDQVVIAPDGVPEVLDADGTVITPAVPPTRITVTARIDPSHVTGRLEEALPADFQNVATAQWGWARDTLTGFGHIEGQTVKVLTDGVVQGPFVVAAGQIGPLNPPALIAVAGLPYNSDAELLDLPAGAVKTNVKAIVKMTWEVVSSRSFLTGESFSKKLHPSKLRAVLDNFGAPHLVTDQVSVDVNSSWNRGARAVIRQADPLPLTVVAAIREVEVGGRGG